MTMGMVFFIGFLLAAFVCGFHEDYRDWQTRRRIERLRAKYERVAPEDLFAHQLEEIRNLAEVEPRRSV